MMKGQTGKNAAGKKCIQGESMDMRKNRMFGFAIKMMAVLWVIAMQMNLQGMTAYAASIRDISTNTVITDTIHSSEEVKYYRFTMDKTGYYYITLDKSEFGTDVGYGWNVSLRDTNDNVYREWNGVTTNLETGRFPFKSGNTFLIKVENRYHYSGPVNHSYRLCVHTVKKAAYEQENNNNLATATVVKPGKVYLGTTWRDKDVDYYRYVVDKDGYFTVNFKKADVTDSALGNGWNLEILDKDGNTIRKEEGITTSHTFKLNFRKRTVVYFKVYNRYGYSGPVDHLYNIKVQSKTEATFEQEPNDKHKTATKLTIGKPKQGFMYTARDIDFYTFRATRTGKVRVVFESKDKANNVGYGWDLLVADKNGNNLVDYPGITKIQKTKTIKVKKGSVYYIGIACRYKYDGPVDYMYRIKVIYG